MKADERLAEPVVKMAEANVKVAKADARVAEAERKLVKADERLAETNKKLMEANKRLVEVENKEKSVNAKLDAAPGPALTCKEIFADLQKDTFAILGAQLSIISVPSTKSTFSQVVNEYIADFKQNSLPPECRYLIETPTNQEILNELYYVLKLVNDELASDTGETRSRTSCAVFCDSTGYEPVWAKGIGEMQAYGKCIAVIGDEPYGSPDNNWCYEYHGYMLGGY